MNRVVRISAVAVLLTGFALPACQADDKEQPANDYELMRLFVDTFQQIETNYVRDVDRRQLVESAIRGMLSDLDQYSAYIPPRNVRRLDQMVEQEFGGIGITVNQRNGRLVVISPLAGTPAYRGGIRAGDLIVEVEGDSAKGMTLNDAIRKLQGPVGRPVNLKVLHSGETEPVEMELVRQKIKAPTVRGERYKDDGQWDFMLKQDPKIGYIRMTQFSRFTPDEIKAALDQLKKEEMQGLVLDLRFNPGGLLDAAIKIADFFLDEGAIVSVKGRNVPERSWKAKKRGTYDDFPMTILVNGYSASASEVLSACLQDNERAVIIGERTWGKGSVQNVIRLEEGNSALKLTTAGYHRPNGVNIHRFPGMKSSDAWGVTPDEGFEIAYSVSEWRDWSRDRERRDVLRGIDEESKDAADGATFEDRQLLAALDYLQEQLQPAETAKADDQEANADEDDKPAEDTPSEDSKS